MTLLDVPGARLNYESHGNGLPTTARLRDAIASALPTPMLTRAVGSALAWTQPLGARVGSSAPVAGRRRAQRRQRRR